MRNFKYGVAAFLIIITIIVMSGCEDDSHDRTTNYYGTRSGDGSKTDKSEPAKTSTVNGPVNQPSNNDTGNTGNVSGTHKVTLRNDWSQPINFTVNGVTKTVAPNVDPGLWLYSGQSVTISTDVLGYPWSQTWNDGLNHNYVATQSYGAPNLPDFYSSN